jgi:hypothetical protein
LEIILKAAIIELKVEELSNSLLSLPKRSLQVPQPRDQVIPQKNSQCLVKTKNSLRRNPSVSLRSSPFMRLRRTEISTQNSRRCLKYS